MLTTRRSSSHAGRRSDNAAATRSRGSGDVGNNSSSCPRKSEDDDVECVKPCALLRQELIHATGSTSYLEPLEGACLCGAVKMKLLEAPYPECGSVSVESHPCGSGWSNVPKSAGLLSFGRCVTPSLGLFGLSLIHI